MTAIFQIVLPMFAVIALGMYAGRYGRFSSAMVQGLSRFLGIYALPALLFSNMARAVIPDPIEWGFLASFYIAALAIFAAGTAWMWAVRRREDAAAVGLASSFSNIALLGVPIIMEAYGSKVAVPVMLLIVFQSPLLFTTATLMAEVRRTAGGRPLPAAWAAVRATMTSPLVLSVAFGLAANLTHVPVPESLMKFMGMLAQTVLPCSCFMLGATLAVAPMTGRGHLARAAVMAVLKTVVHPLLTWVLAAKLFGLSPEWLAPAVTAAALPIGVNAYAFAERYQHGRDVVSLSLLLSTLFFPVSLSVAFMILTG